MVEKIGIQLSDEVVEIDLTDVQELRENASSILEILNSEQVDLSLFLRFALEFKKRGLDKEYLEFLESGLKSAKSRRDGTAVHSMIASALAGHLIEQGKNSKSASLLQKATSILNEATSVNPKDPTIVYCKGLLLLAKKSFDQASSQFKILLSVDKKDVACLLGLAEIQFEQRDYKGALKHLQKALQINSNYQIDLRIPIGLCFYQLGMTKEARKSFERALERNPENFKALLFLSLIDLNEPIGDTDLQTISRKRSATLLKYAFDDDPLNSKVLVTVADLAFKNKRTEIAKLLVNAIISGKAPANSKVESEALLLKAQMDHQEGLYDSAFDGYMKSLELNEKNVPAMFGLGQMCIYKDQITEAIDCFNKVLVEEPSSLEALQIQSSLYDKITNSAKSKEMISKLVQELKKLALEEFQDSNFEDRINDPIMLLQLAKSVQLQDFKAALKYYTRINSLNFKSSHVLNNIGVLSVLLGDIASSKQWFEQALEIANDYTSVTIQYNYARVHELLRDLTKAVGLYEKLVEKHPFYSDALLRLGVLDMDQMKLESALLYYSKVLQIDEKNVDARILMGLCRGLEKNFKESRRVFESILIECDSKDLYSLCAVGNLNMSFARGENRMVYLKRAFEFFDKALKREPNCYFAAMGIAICLAEQGHYQQSRDAFTQIQNTVTQASQATINLSHVLVEQALHRQAASVLEVFCKKNPENQYALQCLCRALYVCSKSEKSIEMAQKCIVSLEKVANDKNSAFNLCLAKLVFASITVELAFEQRPLSLVTQATQLLQEAMTVLQDLLDEKSLDPKLLKDRLDKCSVIKRKLEQKLHETTILEEQREQRKKAVLEMKQKRLQEKQLEEERLIKQEEERQLKIQEARLALNQQLQQDNERMQKQEEEKKQPKKRKIEPNIEDLDLKPVERRLGFYEKKELESQKQVIRDSDDEKNGLFGSDSE